MTGCPSVCSLTSGTPGAAAHVYTSQAAHTATLLLATPTTNQGAHWRSSSDTSNCSYRKAHWGGTMVNRGADTVSCAHPECACMAYSCSDVLKENTAKRVLYSELAFANWLGKKERKMRWLMSWGWTPSWRDAVRTTYLLRPCNALDLNFNWSFSAFAEGFGMLLCRTRTPLTQQLTITHNCFDRLRYICMGWGTLAHTSLPAINVRVFECLSNVALLQMM